MLVLLAMAVPSLLFAQSREPGTLQAAETLQRSANTTSSTSLAYGNDAMSTSMSGAQITLGSGDLLEIAVFDTPELNQKVRVNSDQKILLVLIGEIEVKGISPTALEMLIRSKLVDGHFVKNPQVSVFVAEYAGQMVNVTGEVNRPGAFPLLRTHHLTDLIAVAGGLNARAGSTVTIVRQGDPTSSIVIDMTDKDEKRRNPEIDPGDSITVGQAGIVYVLGDVGRPGGFLLDRSGTLSAVQAVALAEGIMPSASLRKAQLIRTSDGNRQEIMLDLQSILKARTPDPQLQAGDVLYIPRSLTRGMGRQSIETILATVSGMAIYSSYHF
jgi:polysaccharide export outer membrane protein